MVEPFFGYVPYIDPVSAVFQLGGKISELHLRFRVERVNFGFPFRPCSQIDELDEDVEYDEAAALLGHVESDDLKEVRQMGNRVSFSVVRCPIFYPL